LIPSADVLGAACRHRSCTTYPGSDQSHYFVWYSQNSRFERTTTPSLF
jgi:hypothetical protein